MNAYLGSSEIWEKVENELRNLIPKIVNFEKADEVEKELAILGFM